MRPDRLAIQLAVATAHSLRSTCVRRKVGAVLVDGQWATLSTGHNGVPRGIQHCTDEPCQGAGMKSGTGLSLCEAVHAEQNALLFCTDRHNIFRCITTSAPCEHCVKMLLQTNCQEIWYGEEYAHGSFSKRLWEASGRKWKKVPAQLQWLSVAIVDAHRRMEGANPGPVAGLTPLEQSILDRGGHGDEGPNLK